MARDYKSAGSSKRRGGGGGAPGWLWMFAGLAVGLFVALLVYLDKQPGGRTDVADVARTVTDKLSVPAEGDAAPPTPPVTEGKGTHAKPAPAKATGKTDTAAQKPRFDFYNLLPRMEVVIPEQELAASAEREVASKEKLIYFLQAGSFRNFPDADRLKADMALMGIESEIQRVTVNDTETWHRVRVGPFTSLRELGKVRNRMRENNLEPMMIKVKA